MSCQGPFTDVKVHTAKCSVCDQRNRNTFQKCIECGEQFCRDCFAALPPSKAHGPTDAFQAPNTRNTNPGNSGPVSNGSDAGGSGSSGFGGNRSNTNRNNANSSTSPSANAPSSANQQGINGTAPVTSVSARLPKHSQQSRSEGSRVSSIHGVGDTHNNLFEAARSTVPSPSYSSAKKPPTSPASAANNSPSSLKSNGSSPAQTRQTTTPVGDVLTLQTGALVDPPPTPRRSLRCRAQVPTYFVVNVPGALLHCPITKSRKLEPLADIVLAESVVEIDETELTIPTPSSAAASATKAKRDLSATTSRPITSSLARPSSRPRPSRSVAPADSPRRRFTAKAPALKGITAAQAKGDLAAMKSPSEITNTRKRASVTGLTRPSNDKLARPLASSAATDPLMPLSMSAISRLSAAEISPIHVNISDDEGDISLSGNRAPAVTPATGMSVTPVPQTTPIVSVALERLVEHANRVNMDSDKIKKENSPLSVSITGMVGQIGQIDGVHGDMARAVADPAGSFGGEVTYEEGAILKTIPTKSSPTFHSSDTSNMPNDDQGYSNDLPVDEEVDSVRGSEDEHNHPDEATQIDTTPVTKEPISRRLRPRVLSGRPQLAPRRASTTTRRGSNQDEEDRPQTKAFDEYLATIPLSKDFRHKQKEYQKPFSSLGLLEPSKPVLRDDVGPIGSQKDLPREWRWNDPRNNSSAPRNKKRMLVEEYSDDELESKSRAPPKATAAPAERYPTSRAEYEVLGADVQNPPLIAPSSALLARQKRKRASSDPARDSLGSNNNDSTPISHVRTQLRTGTDHAARGKVARLKLHLQLSEYKHNHEEDEDTAMPDADAAALRGGGPPASYSSSSSSSRRDDAASTAHVDASNKRRKLAYQKHVDAAGTPHDHGHRSPSAAYRHIERAWQALAQVPAVSTFPALQGYPVAGQNRDTNVAPAASLPAPRAAREMVVDEEYGDGDEDEDGDVDLEGFRRAEWEGQVFRQIGSLREKE